MAGGALAEHDQILADRLKTELRVKGPDAHDLGCGDPRFFGDQLDRFLGQIAVDLLRVLQNGDKASFDLSIFAEDSVQQRQVNRIFHSFSVLLH